MSEALSNPVSAPKRNFWASRLGLVVQVIVLVALDFASGPVMQFPLFYVVPVMLMAWHWGSGVAIRLAIVLVLLRFICHWVWGFPLQIMPAVWNNIMRGVVLAGLAYGTGFIGLRMRALRKRVAQLEARLPICPGCGLVRDEAGAWLPLENLPVPSNRPSCAACEDRTSGPQF